MTDKTANNGHSENRVSPTGRNETNEYLQTELFREIWHKRAGEYARGWQPGEPIDYTCSCGSSWHSGHKSDLNRDFSTDSDYCALEDKMRKTGDWCSFIEYLRETKNLLYFLAVKNDKRADLIAEYLRSR